MSVGEQPEEFRSNPYRFVTEEPPSRVQGLLRRSLSEPRLEVRCLDSERYRRRDERLGCPVLRKGNGNHEEELKE